MIFFVFYYNEWLNNEFLKGIYVTLNCQELNEESSIWYLYGHPNTTSCYSCILKDKA